MTWSQTWFSSTQSIWLDGCKWPTFEHEIWFDTQTFWLDFGLDGWNTSLLNSTTAYKYIYTTIPNNKQEYKDQDHQRSSPLSLLLCDSHFLPIKTSGEQAVSIMYKRRFPICDITWNEYLNWQQQWIHISISITLYFVGIWILKLSIVFHVLRYNTLTTEMSSGIHFIVGH